MSATIDRTRQEVRADLLAWHVIETDRLFVVAAERLYERFAIADKRTDGTGKIYEFFAPFLDSLQEAGDQLERLRTLLTNEPTA
jgi:hypothetical protein